MTKPVHPASFRSTDLRAACLSQHLSKIATLEKQRKHGAVTLVVLTERTYHSD